MKKRNYRIKIGGILFFVALFLPVGRVTPQTMRSDSLAAPTVLSDSLAEQTMLPDSTAVLTVFHDSLIEQTLLPDSLAVPTVLKDPLAEQIMLPDSIVKERIQVIQRMLDGGKRNANLWWYGWIAAYGAAAITQGAIWIASDKLATRQDMALGVLTDLLGMGGQIISPMVPGYAPGRLENIPGGTPEENVLKLREAEKLLEESAKREKDGRSWKIHVLDGAVNLGCGFIMWFGFDRTFLEGMGNVALNQAVCEIQIFTQPTRAIKDYKTYCRQYNTEQNLSLNEPKVTWSFAMIPGGLGVRLTF